MTPTTYEVWRWVIYKAHVKHRAADALSTLRTIRIDDNEIDDKIPALPFQQQSREQKHQLLYNCQDYDVSKVQFERNSIFTSNATNVKLPTVADLVLAQSEDVFCDRLKQLARTSNCLLTFEKYGLLMKQASLDGSIRWLLFISSRRTVLYLADHSTLVGQPGERTMHSHYVATITGLKWLQTFTLWLGSALIVLDWKKSSVFNANSSYFNNVVSYSLYTSISSDRPYWLGPATRICSSLAIGIVSSYEQYLLRRSRQHSSLISFSNNGLSLTVSLTSSYLIMDSKLKANVSPPCTHI